MSTTTIAVLIAFVCYLAMMIGIGIFSMKKTNSTEDYFLGGRGLNSWVAALSAQASDMSGWLLMGLPGSIYLAGTGKALHNCSKQLFNTPGIFPEPFSR